MNSDGAFLRSRFAIFPILGLGVGILLTLRALLAVGVTAATRTSVGFSTPILMVSYLAGGTLGGVIVALAFPFVRRLGGAFLVGALAVLPLYLGVALAAKGSRSSDDLAVFALVAITIGGVVGVSEWYKEPRRSHKLAHLWLFTVVSSLVAWLVGLFWAGRWPAVLAIALLLGSVALALIVTIEGVPRVRP